jgi:2-methylisocitrate lyase-like PEP mutase family enzyme
MPERRRMTTRLKALFQRPALFVLAGGINPIGAKMAEALGYEAFYMSGGNTSAHQLGWPDSGTSMRDMVDNARKIVLTVQIPVFADADTGYGGAINTYYTVREYIQAGIAGAHIEDQTFPPKAGPPAASGSRKGASREDSSSRKGEAGHSRDNIPMRPLLSRRQLHRQER